MIDIVNGIYLFNEGSFSDAHELWEKSWRENKESPERKYLQGLIMISGALHQYKRGEYRGTSKLLERGLKILNEFKETEINIEKKAFLDSVISFREKFNSSKDTLSEKDFPVIKKTL